MYNVPASAARIACSMVKRVVANVLIPTCLSFLQAWSPSQVAGILIQRRNISKSGANFRQSASIPLK
jgi:hypothetical protein